VNAVFIVPTGLGADIGGHAGDAGPAVRLIASLVDILITHPNAVNASDINEMPDNVWYVEGILLDRFLWGDVKLKRLASHNKILVATNSPVGNNLINSVSAARSTLGAEIAIVELKTPLQLVGSIDNMRAGGTVKGWKELVVQVSEIDFDALAIVSVIEVHEDVALAYLRGEGGPNPWGGVEAIASKLISDKLNKPVAHAPIESGVLKTFQDIVDPRMAAEMVSISYIHSVLKGLHRAPIPCDAGLGSDDISVLISPIGCFGEPHEICDEYGIPIIFVKENVLESSVDVPQKSTHLIVANYWEAAGVLACMNASVNVRSVRRPLNPTLVINSEYYESHADRIWFEVDKVYETRWDCIGERVAPVWRIAA